MWAVIVLLKNTEVKLILLIAFLLLKPKPLALVSECDMVFDNSVGNSSRVLDSCLFDKHLDLIWSLSLWKDVVCWDKLSIGGGDYVYMAMMVFVSLSIEFLARSPQQDSFLSYWKEGFVWSRAYLLWAFPGEDITLLSLWTYTLVWYNEAYNLMQTKIGEFLRLQRDSLIQ